MISIAVKSSRSPDVLLTLFRIKLLSFMRFYEKRTGSALLLVCTNRSAADQEEAFARKASKVRAGRSWHQWGLAADLVPMVGGKPLWAVFDTNKRMHPEWIAFGEEAERAGLEWSGRWKRFIEYGHVQFTAGIDIEDVLYNPQILSRFA